MGLDMYLRGRKMLWAIDGVEARKEDGFNISSIEIELGYWRKHPNLHGYIVQTFADGVDKCQKIFLNRDDIRNIIKAVKAKKLPHTEGFFFGYSDGSEMDDDIATFNAALKWLDAEPKDGRTEFGRCVYYQASW